MKICIIDYRLRKDDSFMHSIRVHSISPEKAIKIAGAQDACEYSVTEFTHPYKQVNKYYSPASGTYNAMWVTQEGAPAYHGNYCPNDGSYCLYYGNTLLAAGKWSDDNRFETFGYSYDEVRKALQLGMF